MEIFEYFYVCTSNTQQAILRNVFPVTYSVSVKLRGNEKKIGQFRGALFESYSKCGVHGQNSSE